MTAVRPAASEATGRSRQADRAAAAVALLRQGFDAEFTILEADTGELVHVAAALAGCDWSMHAQLCREVARRGQPEFVADEDPLLLLAIPLAGRHDDGLVALGAFLTRAAATDKEVERLSECLGLGTQNAARWARCQRASDPRMLERLAQLSAAKWAADQRVSQLKDEVRQLSAHLGSAYEEISLMYRLTHNLKLSSNEEELGRMALAWLAEVLPAEALALELIADSQPDLLTHQSRTEPVLLTHGPCPVDLDAFTRLRARLKLDAPKGPTVINRAATADPACQVLEVRELVIVPVAEGERLFGWLAAFNRNDGAEFGTSEASLLSSVGTMLGIHSGNIDLYRQQAELLTGVVRAMTSAIDAKDPYTRGHSDRVARVAVRLAQELGCDAETTRTIYFSGLLHDVGKIGISEEVLRKPGKLSEAEFNHIKTHVEIGYRILADLRKFAHMLPVVLHHHESWDGKGYPYGLAGENIPYLARIVAVADAFDAMASDRPYRPGMEDAKLDSIMRGGSAQQWDPRVVEAFFRAREDIRGISGRGPKQPEVDLMRWA